MNDQTPDPLDPSASQTFIRLPKPPSAPTNPSFSQALSSFSTQILREPVSPPVSGGLSSQAATMQPLPPSSPFRRTRSWLRSPSGRIILPLLALLIGFAVGLSSLFWYGLSGKGALVIIPPSVPGNFVIDANKVFVTQLVSDDLADAHLPGQVENVTVTLQSGAALIVAGDDVYSFLGVQFSRHFVVNVQPYVHACVLQVRVTQANLGGLPVTSFVQTFQGTINQQLAQKPTGLPQGFAYCTVAVRTVPGDMFITYQAIALKK
jgi:hypothetical protein